MSQMEATVHGKCILRLISTQESSPVGTGTDRKASFLAENLRTKVLAENLRTKEIFLSQSPIQREGFFLNQPLKGLWRISRSGKSQSKVCF